MGSEMVILLDEGGTRIGTAEKATVHTTDTPLHLAFSCHVLDGAGRVLVTRRALTKLTWPGVWTNSVCGHPGPDESMPDAIRRRAQEELGLMVTDITTVAPEFRYRAVDAGGIVENEICPVHIARTDAEPDPDPAEVMEYRWVDPGALGTAVRATPWAFSPWLVAAAPSIPMLAGRA